MERILQSYAGRTTSMTGINVKLQQFLERASSELQKKEMEERVNDMAERLDTPVLILLNPEEIKAYARNSHETNAKGYY